MTGSDLDLKVLSDPVKLDGSGLVGTMCMALCALVTALWRFPMQITPRPCTHMCVCVCVCDTLHVNFVPAGYCSGDDFCGMGPLYQGVSVSAYVTLSQHVSLQHLLRDPTFLSYKLTFLSYKLTLLNQLSDLICNLDQQCQGHGQVDWAWLGQPETASAQYISSH